MAPVGARPVSENRQRALSGLRASATISPGGSVPGRSGGSRLPADGEDASPQAPGWTAPAPAGDAGEDVEHDIGTAGAIGEGHGAGRLDRLKAVLQQRGEDPDDLPGAIVMAGQSGSQSAKGAGQLPALEGRAVTQGTRLPHQNRHVAPRLVGDRGAREAPGVPRSRLRQAQDLPITAGCFSADTGAVVWESVGVFGSLREFAKSRGTFLRRNSCL